MATATLSHPLFGSLNSRRSYSTVRSMSDPGILERKIEEEIEESILRSQYMRRMENLHTLVLQTGALGRVQPNWNSYGRSHPKCRLYTLRWAFCHSRRGWMFFRHDLCHQLKAVWHFDL